MACSSSSSTARSVKRTNIELHYEGPEKYCKCRVRGFKVKAPRWTSWTDDNPGRRFYRCPNYEVKSCGYFEWHDEPVSHRVRDLLNKLKMDKKLLLEENKQLKAIKRGVVSEDGLASEIDELWCELHTLKESNIVEYERLKKKLKKVYVIAIISWIVLVCVLVIL